ncbi:MAG: type II toxin-antitoxin system HicB family antitoxin [Pyrinomonadaceae bacterium]
MHELKFTAIYEKADEGGYVGYVAELPGANTQGETIEETRENLKDAVELLLDCYREDAEAKLHSGKDITKEDLILEAA